MKWTLKIFCPALLMAVLVYLMRGGKEILEGLYFVFPAIYLFIGLLHSKSKADFFLCMLLTTAAFLIPVNIWFNMGACIDLAAIYIVLASVVWWTKRKFAKKRA